MAAVVILIQVGSFGKCSLGQQGKSPLQLTSLLAIIADDGMWMEPSLVLYYIDDEGQEHYPSHQTKEQVLPVDTARQVQHLLNLTIEKGTGRSAALAQVSMAGKTATSQTGQINQQQEEILNTWLGLSARKDPLGGGGFGRRRYFRCGKRRPCF